MNLKVLALSLMALPTGCTYGQIAANSCITADAAAQIDVAVTNKGTTANVDAQKALQAAQIACGAAAQIIGTSPKVTTVAK